MIVSNWKAQNADNAEYIGIIELEDPRPENIGEYIVFEIVKTETYFVFGNSCNTGLLESGNYLINPGFSTDENLQELISDIETYYRDGPEYTTDRFSCNDRM